MILRVEDSRNGKVEYWVAPSKTELTRWLQENLSYDMFDIIAQDIIEIPMIAALLIVFKPGTVGNYNAVNLQQLADRAENNVECVAWIE